MFPKGKQGKGLTRILDCVAKAKVPNCKVSDHSYLKVLSPKQMLQRLPTALAQVIADSTSDNLLNEIRQIIYVSNRRNY